MSNDKQNTEKPTEEATNADFIEIPGFVPVQAELIALLKYWYRENIEMGLWEHFSGQTGGYERFVITYSTYRGEKILALLPKAKTEKAFREVQEEIRKEQASLNWLTEEDWNVFFGGSNEERAKLWDKLAEMREP